MTTVATSDAKEQLEAFWGADPDLVSKQLCEAVMAGIGDAADALAYSMESLTGEPGSAGVDSFFAATRSDLTLQMKNLLGFVRRNVINVPQGTDLNALADAAQRAKRAADNAEKKALDEQISTLRAQIRKADLEMRELNALKDSAAHQIDMMQGLTRTVDSSTTETLGANLRELMDNIAAAENDYGSTSNILRTHRQQNATGEEDPLLMAAASVVSKPQRFAAIPNPAAGDDENVTPLRPRDEEHEPIYQFLPSAQRILQIAMGAETEKLQDLNTLRARLLG